MESMPISENEEDFDIDDNLLELDEDYILTDNSINLLKQKYKNKQNFLNLNPLSIIKINNTIIEYFNNLKSLFKSRRKYLAFQQLIGSNKEKSRIETIDLLIKCLPLDISKQHRISKIKYLISKIPITFYGPSISYIEGKKERNILRQKIKNINNIKKSNIKNKNIDAQTLDKINKLHIKILESYLNQGMPTQFSPIEKKNLYMYLFALKEQEQKLEHKINSNLKKRLDEEYIKIQTRLTTKYSENINVTNNLNKLRTQYLKKNNVEKNEKNNIDNVDKIMRFIEHTAHKKIVKLHTIHMDEYIIAIYNNIIDFSYEKIQDKIHLVNYEGDETIKPLLVIKFYDILNDMNTRNIQTFVDYILENKLTEITSPALKSIHNGSRFIKNTLTGNPSTIMQPKFNKKSKIIEDLTNYIKFLEKQKSGKNEIIQKCIDILIRKVQNKIDEINGNYDAINDAFVRLETKQRSNTSINQDLITKDKQFFDKFKNGFPYSEYEFLYGIENHSLLEEEHKIAFGFVAKASLVSILNAIKAHTIHLGTYLTLAVTGAGTGGYLVAEYLAFHLISRYIFDAYRRTKRMTGYKYVTFCTKYMPFEGMKCFKSSVVSLYHKMFFYDSLNMKTESNVKKFIKKLIFGDGDGDGTEFEKRINTLKHYCGQYKNETKEKNKESESRAKSYKFPEQLRTILGIINNVDVTRIQSNERVNDNFRPNNAPSLGANRSRFAFPLDQGNSNNNNNSVNSQPSRASIRGSKPENVTQLTNQSPVKPTKSWLSSFSRAKGGEKLDYLKSNVGAEKSITGEYRRGINIASTSTKDKLNFRLNYKIGETHLLTSGDISVLSLFNETVGIINSYANMIGGEAKVAWVKIPFFRNDYLLDKINDIFRTTWVNPGLDFNIIKEHILEYIFEYLDSFHKLYKLSEDNIINLMTKKDVNANNSLEDMFQHNLSYYGVPIPGAHKYVGKYKHGIGYRLEYGIDIKLRDKINYFCILMKYSSLAIDHMFKKFKINIVKFNLAKYNAYNEYEEKRNIGLLWGMFKSTPYMMWGTIPTYEEIDEFEVENPEVINAFGNNTNLSFNLSAERPNPIVGNLRRGSMNNMKSNKSTNSGSERSSGEVFEFLNGNSSLSSLSENWSNGGRNNKNLEVINALGNNTNLGFNLFAERPNPIVSSVVSSSVHNGKIHNTISNNSSSSSSTKKATNPMVSHSRLGNNNEKFPNKINYITYTDLEKGCRYKMYNNSKEYMKDVVFNKKSYGNTYVFNIGTYVIDYIKDFYFVKII